MSEQTSTPENTFKIFPVIAADNGVVVNGYTWHRGASILGWTFSDGDGTIHFLSTAGQLMGSTEDTRPHRIVTWLLRALVAQEVKEPSDEMLTALQYGRERLAAIRDKVTPPQPVKLISEM
jgi:hypothetical protein